MKPRLGLFLLLAFTVLPAAGAQTLYLCEDPKSGQKRAQDTPCPTGKVLQRYDVPSSAEQKAREAASRQAKREFERLHPGTYPPEEYMTEEELAVWRADREKREAERKKREDAAAIREAARRAAEAERRAQEAERAAQEAKAKAAAAEEAASQASRPILVVPTPAFVPTPPPPPLLAPRLPQAPRALPNTRPRCDRDDCREEAPRREGHEPPATGRRSP